MNQEEMSLAEHQERNRLILALMEAYRKLGMSTEEIEEKLKEILNTK